MVLLSSQNSYIEILSLKMMVLQDRAFGICLGHDEGGALMKGIGIFT